MQFSSRGPVSYKIPLLFNSLVIKTSKGLVYASKIRADFNKMLLCAHVHEFLFKLKSRTKRGVGKSTGSLHCVEKGNEVAIISSVWLVSCKNIVFIFHLLHHDYLFIDQFSCNQVTGPSVEIHMHRKQRVASESLRWSKNFNLNNIADPQFMLWVFEQHFICPIEN